MRNVMYRTLVFGVFAVYICLVIFSHTVYGYTGSLGNRYDQLSSATPGVSAINTVGFTISDVSQPLGSIELQFCEESPLPGDSCTVPPGLDASNVNLGSQTGNTGFSVASNSTLGTVILTRSPAIPTTSVNTYQLNNIVNPTAAGTYYLRLSIFSTTDGSGTATQQGGIALSTVNSLLVSAEVPPYLKFCTGVTITNYDCSTAIDYSINLGELNSHTANVASSQFLASTNAASGYSITITGPTMTSGNNIIANPASPEPSVVNSSEFGINLRANSAPNIGADPIGPGVAQVSSNYAIPNRFMYQDGDTLVSAASGSDNQTFTVSYLTNVGTSQPAGVYSTTLTFICLANF